MYDLAIIGGGPAGAAAGVYAGRKRLKTIFITESFGGQSVVSTDIQNWIGTISISGDDLASSFRKHVEAYADDVLSIKEGIRAEKVEKTEEGFKITLQNKDVIIAKTVLVSTGASRRKLDVPGASEYENRGITYCASCDGPMFGGKDVVVIGGGNAGFETAAQLLSYCKSVTLLQHAPAFKADQITIDKVLSHPNMKAFVNAATKEIKGDKFAQTLVYEDKTTGESHEIRAEGIFVEIGLIPATSMVEGLVEMTPYKQIKVDHRTQRTSISGIWSAGDCTDAAYHQNNIAAGDGVKALEDIYMYLHAK